MARLSKVHVACLAVALAGSSQAGTPLAGGSRPEPTASAELVTIPAGSFQHRLAGEFTRAGRPANAPIETRRIGGFAIMKRQVTLAEYRLCAGEGACPPPAAEAAADPDRPVVQVSWRDATSYAAWLSRKTGESYRLPSDEEWAYAAAERFRDDALPESDGDDPAKRWIARYEQESERDQEAEPKPQPIGRFGTNDRGLLDIAGNVWEWTSTCYRRVSLDAEGARTGEETVNCGVRVVEGRHRAYMSDFVRDARSGGCAVGKPPSNLGFRLVRDDGFWEQMRGRLKRVPWLGS